MSHDSLLIDKSRSVHPAQRTAWGVATAVLWFLYIYLFLPLLTLLLWLLGFRRVWSELYLRSHTIDPFLVKALPILFLAAATTLLAWAEYNRWRFRGKERRLPADNASGDDVARSLGASPEVARTMVDGKIVALHMDADAYPRHATASSIADAATAATVGQAHAG